MKSPPLLPLEAAAYEFAMSKRDGFLIDCLDRKSLCKLLEITKIINK